MHQALTKLFLFPQLTCHTIHSHNPGQSGAVVNIFAHIDLGDQLVILDGGRKVLFHLLNQRLEVFPLVLGSGPVVDLTMTGDDHLRLEFVENVIHHQNPLLAAL